ncbi:MAG: hypothetical protein R3E95_11910 [Thiolinea sp.]
MTGYTANPDHAADSRWLHRPRQDWTRAEQRHVAGTSGNVCSAPCNA